MFRIALRSLLSHKLRLALTAIAIVLGVSFVAGTLIITDTISGVFSNIFNTAQQGVAVVVTGQKPPGGDSFGGGTARPLPESVVATVKQVSGVQNAVGAIFRPGADLVGPDGKVVGAQGPPHFGASWITDPVISQYHLRSGGPPTTADAVVVDATTASAQNISVGQPVKVSFNGAAVRTFQVSGIAGFGTSNSIAGASILLFRTDVIAAAFETPGKIDAIQCSAASGVDQTTLRDRVAKVVPAGDQVSTGADTAAKSSAAAQGIISLFVGTPLLVFAIISLFVGSFLIVNTFTILVTQRSRELALLRALGATRRQVLTSVLFEAALTGLVMSIVGALVGVLMAKGIYAVLGKVGFALPAGDLVLSGRTFLVAILLGTGVTLAASVLPARRATKVAPVAALREAEPELQGVSKRRIIIGAVVTLLGGGLFAFGLFGNTGQTLQVIGAGALVLFIGIAILAPLLVQPIAFVLGAPAAALRGVPGQLAQANARRSPRRTASTAAALMIGVALVASVDVIAESLKVSGTKAIDGSLSAQLFVSGQRGFSPQVANSLRRDRNVTEVAEVRAGPIVVNGASQDATALDPAALGPDVSFDVVSGDPATALHDPHGLIVDSTAAKNNGWNVGTPLTVVFSESGNSVNFRVGATYRSNALLSGIIVPLPTFVANVPTQRDFAVAANPAPGIALSDAKQSMKTTLKNFPTANVQDRADLEKQQSDQIGLLQNVIFVLLFLAIVIAFFGIVNTLALSIIERTRELGLLRAMGMTRRQMRSMVRWEALIIALLGAVLGMGVGIGLGIAIVRALADAGLGYVAIPAAPLIICLVIALLLGVGAAVLPAFRAGRLDVLRAIATE